MRIRKIIYIYIETTANTNYWPELCTSLMEFANATVLDGNTASSTAFELGPLLRALFKIFFVTGLGYGAVITSFIPKTSLAGINVLIGKVCLPLLIFRSVAQIDFSAVEPVIVISCMFAKFVSVFLGC